MTRNTIRFCLIRWMLGYLCMGCPEPLPFAATALLYHEWLRTRFE